MEMSKETRDFDENLLDQGRNIARILAHRALGIALIPNSLVSNEPIPGSLASMDSARGRILCLVNEGQLSLMAILGFYYNNLSSSVVSGITVVNVQNIRQTLDRDGGKDVLYTDVLERVANSTQDTTNQTIGFRFPGIDMLSGKITTPKFDSKVTQLLPAVIRQLEKGDSCELLISEIKRGSTYL